MTGELGCDAGLTRRDQDMLECLDRLSVDLQTRSKFPQVVASLFKIVQTNALLLANIEELQ